MIGIVLQSSGGKLYWKVDVSGLPERLEIILIIAVNKDDLIVWRCQEPLVACFLRAAIPRSFLMPNELNLRRNIRRSSRAIIDDKGLSIQCMWNLLEQLCELLRRIIVGDKNGCCHRF